MTGTAGHARVEPLLLINEVDNLFPKFRTASKNLQQGIARCGLPRSSRALQNAFVLCLGDHGPGLSKALVEIVQQQGLMYTGQAGRKTASVLVSPGSHDGARIGAQSH